MVPLARVLSWCLPGLRSERGFWDQGQQGQGKHQALCKEEMDGCPARVALTEGLPGDSGSRGRKGGH